MHAGLGTMNRAPVTIIGAGPAGLAAAHELVANALKPLVLETGADVGGIARTVSYKGCRFDIGGHRFFTKLSSIHNLWQNMLGPDLISVKRKSSILYSGHFYDYPLRTANALQNLGIVESARIFLSYVQAQLLPNPTDDTFEQWMSNRFGSRLFQIFFKTYTEKVWGRPCNAIQADWAAQRIKGLSMRAVVTKALFGAGSAKTLIDSFHYPRGGPGMMWERFQEAISRWGGKIQTNCTVTSLKHSGSSIVALQIFDGLNKQDLSVDHVISSMPIPNLIGALDPAPPGAVKTAAENLSYRALMMAGLIVNRENLFPEQWIYIHDPDVAVGRIQNFRNWSPDMVADGQRSNLGMEYFCNEGDQTWNMSDKTFIDMASGELEKLGLAAHRDVLDGIVIRQAKAYPIYDHGYRRNLAIIRRYLNGFKNLQTIGRNGTHRYNNMDHSMQSGILAARNILGENFDLWHVNDEAEYHEEIVNQMAVETPGEIVAQVFTRMDKTAFGTAVGTVTGLAVCVATLWLIIKGGPVVGPKMGLLAQYFGGYTVTYKGALVGCLYGFVAGFCSGWLFAFLRNFLLLFYLFKIRKSAEYKSLRDLLDQI